MRTQSKPMKQISVVILNWNGANLLTTFLPSVIKYSEHIADIYVAANGSTDNSIEVCRTQFPTVKIIDNKENHGFAGGYNLAIQEITTPYTLLLNSDVEVTENWLEPLVTALENDPFLAAVQPKIKAFHEKDYFEYAGASGGFLDKNFFPFCRGRLFNVFEEDQGQYNTNKEIFWASGAAMLTRTNLYKQVKGLDADYFAHMEEIDLCWRFKNMGYRIGVIPAATVFHVGGATLSQFSTHKLFLNFRNSLFLIFKNYRGVLFTKLFARLFLDGIASAKFLLEGNFGNLFAVLKAHIHFYLQLPKLIRKRRANKKTWHKTPNMIGWYQKNITFQFFLKKKKHFSDLNPNDFI